MDHATAQSPAPATLPHRAPERLLAVARIAAGLFFLASGLPKLLEAAAWAGEFARWGVPLPELAVYGVGTLEVVGGALLALGAFGRPVAAVLTALMVGALGFAGTSDGGQHIVLPVVLGTVTAVVAVRGSGRWQARRRTSRR